MTTATKYLEAAKIEELAQELTARGYTVQVEAPVSGDPGAPRFDILAQRGRESIAIEVSTPENLGGAAAQLSHLRRLAHSTGIKEFQVVVARPPPQISVEVEGLESELESFLTNHVPKELLEICPRAVVTDVHDVDIDEITVNAKGIFVAGEGLIRVNLAWGDRVDRDGTDVYDNFPFRFLVTLDTERRIIECDVQVDTTSWDE